jgi:hypothetical protein
VIVVIPHGMDTRDWVDRTAGILAPLVSVLKIQSDDEWRTWGSHVRQVLSVKGILTPDPDEFEDWVEWASRLNQIIATL